METQFNIAVIGLSGADEHGVEFKVGKSFLCNRFVRSAQDDLLLHHESIFNAKYLEEPVINRDNFLYWGAVSMRTEETDQVHFCVIEFTDIRSKEVSPLPLSDYLTRTIVSRVCSKNKLMYISLEQVQNVSAFSQEKMPTSVNFEINGYLLAICADPNAFYTDTQIEFLVEALEAIKEINLPVLIVATKCDEIPPKSCFSEALYASLERIRPGYKLTVPVIETSALLNVNITAAFQTLHFISRKNEQQPKIRTYLDAYRTVETRSGILVDGFSSMIIFASERLLTLSCEKFIEIHQENPKVKSVIKALGKAGTRNIFEAEGKNIAILPC